MESLPKDDAIMISYLNTKLRDGYGDLGALCDDLGLDRAETEARALAAGYAYDAAQNRFVAR